LQKLENWRGAQAALCIFYVRVTLSVQWSSIVEKFRELISACSLAIHEGKIVAWGEIIQVFVMITTLFR
jgi:hypothetical protein